MGMNDVNSLSHTKWNCKYHIVSTQGDIPCCYSRQRTVPCPVVDTHFCLCAILVLK